MPAPLFQNSTGAVKFGAFYEFARRNLEAEYIATGKWKIDLVP